ncbi:unnamed protein product [Brassicogethes aeneus]|uniref:G-protein coupled receptors family 1 profile domain-containing protein n=1 Tax=Brassicogethes aeneus TaxID=1431903 RepID=A0A9P0BAI7_BRAAE|nr:unnamed protein product [Brassicogethes aeneus]
MTPLRPRMGRTVTLILAMCTWIMGVILGIPSLIYYKTYTLPYPDGEARVICYPEWPDGVTNLSMMEYIILIESVRIRTVQVQSHFLK